MWGKAFFVGNLTDNKYGFIFNIFKEKARRRS